MANTKITNHIVDKTFISGLTAVTPVAGDYVIIGDTSDSNNLKKALVSGLTDSDTSLLATDIKIGEDDQTKIDFETADEIHFYAANAHQVKLIDGAIVPVTDNDIDLGTSSLEFKDGYFDGTLYADAIDLAGTALTAFNTDAAQVFNESGAAVDFRIEGDTEQNLFFVDGSADKIGIGTASPAASLHINTSTNSPMLVESTHGDGGYIELQLSDSGGAGSLTGYIGDSEALIASGTAADLAIRAQANFVVSTGGSTSRMIINSSGNVDFKGEIFSTGTGGGVQIDNGNGVTVRETMAATGHAWQNTVYNTISAGNVSMGGDSSGTSHMWFNSYDTGSKYSVKAGHSADLYHGISNGQFVLRMSANPTSSNGEGITMLQRLYIDKDGTFQLHSAGTNDTTIKFYKGASTIKWWMQNDTSGSPGSDAFWIGDEENDNGVYVVQDGSSWQGISDERLKRNWTNLTGACDKIDTLTKVGTFNRRGKTTGKWSDNKEVGLSAQEVEAILPEIVTTGGDLEFASDDKVTGVKGMSYEKLVPLLVKAIQELNTRLKAVE